MKKSKDKKILKLVREIAVKRADGKCEICRKGGVVHFHHFYGRRARSVRWDIDNIVILCPYHHKLGIESAHESPEWFRGEMIRIRGKEWLDKLTKKWHSNYKLMDENEIETKLLDERNKQKEIGL